MQGKTHRQGGVLVALVAFQYMKAKGLLIPNTNEYVQLLVMYPFALWGSIAPDLDHGKQSIPARDPVSVGIHKILELTQAKHRSWQTHSIAVTGGILLMMYALLKRFLITHTTFAIEGVILQLILYGIIFGVASHLLLDLITPAGIYLTPGIKLRLAPNNTFFATGGTWENIIRNIIVVLNIILMIYTILGIFGINPLHFLK